MNLTNKRRGIPAWAVAGALLIASLACMPAVASGLCFVIHDDAGQLVYRAMQAPIDMRLQISEGLRAAGLNGHLTFYPPESSAACGPEVDQRAAHIAARTAAPRTQPFVPDEPHSLSVRRAQVAPSHADVQSPVSSAAHQRAIDGLAARHPPGNMYWPTNGRTIYTGSRGGQYYLTDHGTRVYVRRGRR